MKKKLEGRDFIKEKARVRDNYTCQNCDKKWEEGQRRFDVHHTNFLLSMTEARKYKNNKDFDKMITLCHKCHLNILEHRKAMKERKYKWVDVLPHRLRHYCRLWPNSIKANN